MTSDQVNGIDISDLPGAEPYSAKLVHALRQALKLKPANYRPRTQHLNTDGSPKYTNRLILEASPYLQQHAHNPINWFPWGDKAFSQAHRFNRPMFVSIGYSTCHWCHVMEEESFDNTGIAEFINQHFIAIKIDREMRPDVDAIYMRSVQAMTGQGGWPLNIFLLPDKQAFYGGTYFPPNTMPGRPSLLSVLHSVHKAFHENTQQVHEFAKQLTVSVKQQLDIVNSAQDLPLSPSPLHQIVHFYQQQLDPQWGGIGQGIKFPSNTPVRLLLQQVLKTRDQDLTALVQLTLDKMASGGLFDQLGGGFHRYSTDRQWLVPHFEKMLYDNAQLSLEYLAAWQYSKKYEYRVVVEQTLDYILREMTAPEGGFYSATDADSLDDSGVMQEGWFFTWSRAEIFQLLNHQSATLICAWFGITDQGQYEERNVLHRLHKTEDFAAAHNLSPSQLRQQLSKATNTMLNQRNKRSPPLRDNKIITAWNGLMIAAFAKASFALDRADYLQAGQKAADFILANMLQLERLERIYLEGHTQQPALLTDYAYFIYGLLELYQADTNSHWLTHAIALQKTQDQYYLDQSDGLYFISAEDAKTLLYKEKPCEDGVMPSGNAVSAVNLLQLYALTGELSYQTAALKLLHSVQTILNDNPLTMTYMLTALDIAFGSPKEIVLLCVHDAENTPEMLKILQESFMPHHTSLVVNSNDLQSAQIAQHPLLAGKTPVNNLTTAYICTQNTCQPPINDPAVFYQQLHNCSQEE